MTGARLVLLALALPASLPAQAEPPPDPGTKTAVAAAGARYQAGGFKRFFLGDTYRDLWATPIRVPVLDIGTFAGGLKPTRRGGGNQTKSVRFEDKNGAEYVFRLVDKDNQSVPDGFEGTIVESMSRDQVSAHHPAAAVVAAPLIQAAGLLHVTPVLMIMPDDPRMGEFREEFAGRLGTIEAYPNKPDNAPGFAGAIAIEDTEELRPMLDKDASTRIDAPALLAARLMDMLLNDWDRHPGNWKWAQMRPGGAWEPIPRDRDKVMISYGGIIAAAGKFSAKLITFSERYPKTKGLTWNSIEFDRRFLSGLGRPVYDSVAAVLVRKITDRVIDAAVRSMPREYQADADAVSAILKARRDQIPEQASRFYLYLASVVDLHATDEADRARVHVVDGRYVDVEIATAAGKTYFKRRFDAQETRQLRLYLHGGDDAAEVTGPPPPMAIRVIGGNGTNRLVDGTGGKNQARLRFYDDGVVTGIGYGPDTLINRRPWLKVWGHEGPPGKDRGGKFSPIFGFTADGDLGVVPKLGVQTVKYGFRTWPHASRMALIGEYATRVDQPRVTLIYDQRRESSSLHLTGLARLSGIEVVNFHGLGNDTPDGPLGFFEARQRQWLLHPAVAWALGPRSDLYAGPVIQFSETDSVPDRYISTALPYGSGTFGQAGFRVGLLSDGRDRSKYPNKGLLLDLSATAYPGIWDVRSAFAVLSGSSAAYVTLPVPVHPVLALRANAKKVFGDFPWHESAFLGGRGSVRKLDRERYAGDASISGTVELQVPVARFALILPLDIGVYGFADAGRVYVNGQSPGGWHQDAGLGIWVGMLNPVTSVSFEFGDQRGRSTLRVRTGLTF